MRNSQPPDTFCTSVQATGLGKRFSMVNMGKWNAARELWKIVRKEAIDKGMEQSTISKLRAPTYHQCSNHHHLVGNHRHLVGLDHIQMLYFISTPPER